MTDFLFYLGALSLGGGLVGLILMATGLLTRSRYAARWRCWGWLLPLRAAFYRRTSLSRGGAISGLTHRFFQ